MNSTYGIKFLFILIICCSIISSYTENNTEYTFNAEIEHTWNYDSIFYEELFSIIETKDGKHLMLAGNHRIHNKKRTFY